MRLRKIICLSASLLAICALTYIAYRVIRSPSLERSLSWRLDAAQSFVRSVFWPVGALPTAAVASNTSSGDWAPALDIPTRTALPPTASPTPGFTVTPGPTSTPQPTPTITASPTPLPAKVVLQAPKWESQDWNNCGPATLAMYLRLFGFTGDQFTISNEIKPLRADRNVNVDELAGYVARHEKDLSIFFRVGGTTERLRQFLAAGMPVMIEEGFYIAQSYIMNDDHWAGHYLLLTGYDTANQFFIAQDSELGRDRIVAFKDLDKNWQAFNRVYILIYTADKDQDVQNIMGDDMDPDVSRQHALDTSLAETKATPRNAYAWFNLGSNLVYFERYDEAAKVYDTARSLHLPQRMLRYQFGPFLAYFHSLRNDDLLALADYALNVTPNSEEALLWKGWGLFREGKRVEAADLFRKALENRPGYSDALYALKYMQNN
jgi:tetratricopeptide (TPR) repeat protein